MHFWILLSVTSYAEHSVSSAPVLASEHFFIVDIGSVGGVVISLSTIGLISTAYIPTAFLRRKDTY